MDGARSRYDNHALRVYPSRGRNRDQSAHSKSTMVSNRIPGIGFLPHTVRNHFIAMCGEFTGTFLFLFFALAGTQVANTTNLEDPPTRSSVINTVLYISLCFGFSLAVNAWVFFRISGGLFNPAVSLGLVLIGAVPPIRGALAVVSQILGAIASAAVVSCLYPYPMAAATRLEESTSVVQGLFIEMFLTTQLVFTIFMLAAEKHKATFLAPIGIGLALFIAELAGVFFTGGSLNPARSFGPDVVSHSFPSYHWIYWIGPGLGAIVAAGFYWLMKKLEYETANPNQDANREVEIDDPEKGIHDQEDAKRVVDNGEERGRSTGDGNYQTRNSSGKSRDPTTPKGIRKERSNDANNAGMNDSYGSQISPMKFTSFEPSNSQPSQGAEPSYGYFVPAGSDGQPDYTQATQGQVMYMKPYGKGQSSSFLPNGGHTAHTSQYNTAQSHLNPANKNDTEAFPDLNHANTNGAASSKRNVNAPKGGNSSNVMFMNDVGYDKGANGQLHTAGSSMPDSSAKGIATNAPIVVR